MSTKPTHSTLAIAEDARHVLAAAKEDAHDAQFKKRVGSHELSQFEADIAALEAGETARTTRLHAKVAAGAHVADARAQAHDVIEGVREDARIAFDGKGEIQKAFGVGMRVSYDSTPQVKEALRVLIDGAHEHAAEAKAVGLDTHGLHDVEHMIHALEGLDAAHVLTATARHANSTATDSLAHKVEHEAAHLRLIARRAFKKDEAKLARYRSTLPRHEVKPRAKPAQPIAPTTP
ncbi:MAG TPA: hypothetical protein VGH28_10290 [Polyangiaceae bacterium]|jgi:hypothetical protein